jgi:adenine-specific DNA-methyltransferase
MQNMFKELEQLLLGCEDFNLEGKLNKPKIEEQALSLEPQLLKLLLSHTGLKKHFFQDIEGLMVFDKVKFQKFISNKQFLPDSYTQFKNKIGLTINNGLYLSESKDVVLAFPYKDCVLQGGQDKEDTKRDEVFFNETLVPDDIDMLLEPKVLKNFKKFNATGEHKVTNLTPQDNLIIKGNNLLALHSLLSVYRGKVKLIYIDPPYNTGNDSFGYNDKFNHSTWLTFMKNRLEIAKELLRDDGVIAVQCSFHEYAYLKVLMDEIYEKGSELCTFNIQVRHPDRILTGDKSFNDVMEYMILYSKSKEYKFPTKTTAKLDDDYIYQIVTQGAPHLINCGDKIVEVYLPEQYQEIKGQPNPVSLKIISVRGSLREKNSSGRFYVKYIEPLKDSYPPRTLFKVPNMGDDIYSFRYFHLPVEGNKNGSYYQGKPTSSDVTETPYANFYNYEKEYNNVAGEGDVSFRNGKKPEEMIGFIIDIFTKPCEIILDYHLGSGTTAAVAHKMGRQYIGIEQMDYIEDLVVTRLKNVIGKVDDTKDLIETQTKYKEFDTSGVSKSVNWHGGGEFIYCELKQNNQLWLGKITNATDCNELLNVWNIMQDKAQLSYRVDVKSINNSVDEFKQLAFEEQKKFLFEIIDKNQLYVNYTEIEDVDYQSSEEEKKLNNIFYGLK